MRIVTMLFAALLVATPLLAQDEPAKKEPAKDTPKAETKTEEAPKREMTAEGTKLFDDVKRVYGKYYEIVLEKIKTNATYKAEEVWDTAVKEAKNATYKDNKEWTEAVLKMKKADRVFATELVNFTNKMAKEHAEAVRKWADESDK
ncbi:MAG: hypothetical protein IPP14_09425 [Planctomycetes bacterium]|nr:hypothetical protein [Planctomycetota bacterium]